MSPFDAFCLYLALRQHFTSDSYDYFKYNGKLRVNQTTFDTRKDKYMFFKLSKRDDIFDFLVANLSEKPELWVGDLFNAEHEKNLSEYKRKKESLTYVFKNDIEHLLENFDENFRVKEGDYPHLLKLFCQKKISKETFIILNDCVSFFGSWNRKISDPVLWPKIALSCKKFYPFMQYQREKYINILQDKYVS
jgi:hypothetical protein